MIHRALAHDEHEVILEKGSSTKPPDTTLTIQFETKNLAVLYFLIGEIRMLN